MKILMGSRWFLVAGLLVAIGFGCAERKLNAKLTTVQFEIVANVPHCGGAPPDPSVSYPMVSPQYDREYEIFKTDLKGEKRTKVAEFKTDEAGKATVQVPAGSYQLFMKEKSLSAVDFMNSQKQFRSEVYVFEGIECFEKWQKMPDHLFKTDGDLVRVEYDHRCFVGYNPCLEYTGPPPP